MAAQASRGISIRGIDGTYARTAIAARIKSARVVIGIRDAVEKSSRRAGLTLLVARKGAVGEARKIIALNAKGIAAAETLERELTGTHAFGLGCFKESMRRLSCVV